VPDKIRIVFWGSPRIAAEFLCHLVAEQAEVFSVVACVTQTEKVIQRQGKTAARSAVHQKAEELGIPVFTPKSVKKEADVLLAQLHDIGFDLFVVLAYGKILPVSIIDAPRLKSVNFHGSLLPLLRGASPIEHALLNGFTETGWTLQRIVTELDAGDIVAQSKVEISPTETTETLYPKLTKNLLEHGARMLAGYVQGKAQIMPQNHALATHCGKISSADGKIDFSRPAMEIHNKYRAFTPRPGVFASFRGKKVKLAFEIPDSGLWAWRADSSSALHVTGEGPGVGSLVRDGKSDLWILCGDGNYLKITMITPEGKKAMAPGDFINGYRVVDGDVLA
jgi:methionyl-tRNA formyltransferase